jgi:adenine deaminase
MMNWDTRRLTGLIDAALGRKPMDLCVRNCRIVNVFTGSVEQLDIGISGGFISGWGRCEAVREIDAEGMYACPGFIDAHIHVESSLLSPPQFCAAVVPWGTSAVVSDPHEIANVLGLDGIRYLVETSRGLPLDMFFNLPSCVPATGLETCGAQLRAADLHSILPHDRILGLAEMMNFPGVLMGLPDIIDKLVLFNHRRMDGHAPLLQGAGLDAYLAAGISSDHECTTLDEAREKLEKGMFIMIREGSQSKDLETLLPAVDDHTWPRCMFISDDTHPDDLVLKGHMNAIVNKAMALGMNPVRALCLATLTPASYFGLTRRGAIGPGYRADFSLSPTLNPWIPARVFKDGVEVAADGRLLDDSVSRPAVSGPGSPMNITRLSVEDLAVPAEQGMLRIIGIQEGSLHTRKILAKPRIEGNLAVADVARDILKLVVYNRYLPDRPPSVGFVQGFGLKRGALATTVAHDSHNLIAVGTSDADIVHVVDTIRRIGGGMAAGVEKASVEHLALPVAGLMSEEPVGKVSASFQQLRSFAQSCGSKLQNPFMALSFLALPVIPELKLTDLGLVDVSTFSFVPVFQKE